MISFCGKFVKQYQAGKGGEEVDGGKQDGRMEGQKNVEGVDTRATGNEGKGTDATLRIPFGSMHAIPETRSLGKHPPSYMYLQQPTADELRDWDASIVGCSQLPVGPHLRTERLSARWLDRMCSKTGQ
jgi:hypothetical protein